MSISLVISLFFLFVNGEEFSFKDQTAFYTNLEPETNFYSETGYVEVNDINNGNNQFFYHLFLKEGVQSLNDIKETDNFVLWLNGGPGCSSLYHIFVNVGPYHVKKIADNDFTVIKGKNTWNKIAHVIFLDQPFDVGFSYSEPKLNISNSDQGALYVVEFFRGFIKYRPQFKKTNFYVFGLSYGGHYIPAIGAAIKKSNLEINFKGVGIGNGWMDSFEQSSSYSRLLYSLGIYNEQKRDLTEQYMADSQNDIMNNDYFKASLHGSGRMFLILANYTGEISPYDFQDYMNIVEEDIITKFIIQNSIQFGAPPNIVYSQCSEWVATNFIVDVSKSQKYNIEYLINQGSQVLIYSGSRDIICNTPSVNQVVNTLNWPGLYEWKKQQKDIFYVQNQNNEFEPAGTIKQYQNFIFATIYNAGHMVFYKQPLASLKLLEIFFAQNVAKQII